MVTAAPPCDWLKKNTQVRLVPVSQESRDMDKMADDREPPPLFGEEENVTKDDDNDDIFASAKEVNFI